ncbi:MAG: hypothetical protein ACXADD_12945 [Candidatus Thorarchaeota archaeon]|jgi:glycine hydroxymethyltransferase
MNPVKNNRQRVDELRTILSEHEKNRSSFLNLVASENALSPLVRSALASDLAGRYSSEFYGGSSYARRIIENAEELAKELFRSEYACVAPISGHVCDLAALFGLTSPGEKIALVGPDNGGYPFDIHQFGRTTAYLPFDLNEWTLDYSNIPNFFQDEKPNLTMLGASAILFPYDIPEVLSQMNGESSVVYDASHVLGLIAGNKFQDPLGNGIGAMFGSTHKSFPGPQGGIILGNDLDMLQKIVHQFSIQTSEHPFGRHHGTVLVDNVHSHRIAALSIALLEMIEFGSNYASQIIANSKALAKALLNLGYPVTTDSRGISTESHQVIIRRNDDEGLQAKRKLESCGIYADAFMRIGTSEVTRRGYKEEDMKVIAELIHQALTSDTPAETIKREVEDFCVKHSKLSFCFNDIESVL